MLIVSKKKITLTRIIMWGGLVLAAVGAVMTYMEETGMECVALLAAGLVISLLGATAMKRLFRCPNCKKSVLTDDSKIDLRNTNCPTRCPYCGTPVQLEE